VRTVKVLLRVVLTVLLVYVAVKAGIMLAPRLAQFGAGPRKLPSSLSAAEGRTAQPDWGGGRLSATDRSVASVVDSVRAASGGDSLRTRAYSGPIGGVVLRQKPDLDYAITLAMPSPGRPGRTALFELPSSDRFKEELLPDAGDAQEPAADIPLYPESRCRMQVGRGTAYFVGFYTTPDSIEAVRLFYVRALGKLGWQRVAAKRPGYLETFAKRNENRAVLLQLREQDSTTTRIGLVAMASGRPDRSERK
jgi:hypothetical protein